MQSPFVYKRRVAFHETDAMAVVHHSNHIRWFEEARVAWLREAGLMELHVPEGPVVFAVVRAECRYMRTARFDDAIEIYVEARREGLRLQFRYAVKNARSQEWIAEGSTDLVPLDKELRPVRLHPRLRELLSEERWGPSWPPSLA